MSSSPNVEPQAEYQRRLAEWQQRAAVTKKIDERLSLSRGIVFLAGIVTLVLIYSSLQLAEGTLLIPLVLFVVLVVIQGRVVDQIKRAQAAVVYYETSLARLADRWIGMGASGQRYSSPEHVYADDLDLFGRGSLFQLLSRARTRLGEDRLANWLCHSADVATVRKRQQALEELRHSLDLRERLALLDAEVHDELDQKQLLEWSGETPQPLARLKRSAALIISAAAVITLTNWLFFEGRPTLLVLVLIVMMVFTFGFRKQIRHLVKTADEANSGLAILAQVLDMIEREEFQSPLLGEIRSRLDTGGLPPSHRIAQLHRLIQALNNSLQNQFYAPIAFLFCLPIHLVHRIERWRAQIGTHIPDWLDAVGEFEALSTLAGYAWERPNDPFPELIEGGSHFEGEALGHPLLPAAECVRNDLVLADPVRLIVISGSNMSGKSTLLRTVGTNTVLALAGAPVRAKQLRLSPLQLGSAMRIHDSLQDGKSLFYAGLSRLKTIVSLTENEQPLLYLLDEILQGTNSHDRRVGAEGVIRKLVEQGAIGLVTTHDLALTRIVDSLDKRAVNLHFEDRIVDGKMTFDYNIRPGVVERSNALELMRMIGLDV